MTEQTYFQKKEKEYWIKIWKTLEEMTNEPCNDLLISEEGKQLEKKLKEWAYINHCVEKEKEDYKFHNDEWVY
jgi:hypothetical protein